MRVIICRDVIFNKKECCNWKGGNKEELNKPGISRMTWGATMDDGHDPFVVETQQEESAAEETEAQLPEHVQDSLDVEQVVPQQPTRSTHQSNRPSYLEE